MIMATGRFRSPKTKKEEIALLSETVLKNTRYNTKWAVNTLLPGRTQELTKLGQVETGTCKSN